MKRILCLTLMLLFASTALAEFPLVTEPATLQIMGRVTPSYPEQDNSKVSCMIAYENLSGVHIEWDNVLKANFAATLAGNIAAEDYPDIIMRGNISVVDANEWGEEGILVDLAPYLEEYAPNFYALMKAHPSIEQAITNANGQIFGLPQVGLASCVRIPYKVWYNTKALEAAGYTEFPKTLEELKALLLALKDTQYNAGLSGSVNAVRNTFYGSFGLRTRGHHYDVVDVDPETGKVRIFAQSENFRKNLEYMHDLYANGLIYPEIFTDGDKNIAVQSGEEVLGVFVATTTFSVPQSFIADWDGVPYVLEGPDGYSIYSAARSDLHSVNNFCITDHCKDVGLALRWVDYFYSDEGSQFFLLGVKGKDWEDKEDGTRYWTDAALASWGSDMNEDTFKAQFGMWAGGNDPALFTDNLFGSEYAPLPVEISGALLNYVPEVTWPIFNWTEEENSIIKTVEGDIKKYIQNSYAQAVAGEIEITDAWWNDFVAQIDAMGAEKLIGVYEQVLARVYPDGNY